MRTRTLTPLPEDEGYQLLSCSEGVYWSLITAASIVYGDITPRTQLGRLLPVSWVQWASSPPASSPGWSWIGSRPGASIDLPGRRSNHASNCYLQ